MSNIDKQALREAAVRAGGVKWQYMRATQHSKAYITDDKGSPIVNCTDGDVPAKCAGFLESANPAAVLALLDELEAKDAQIVNLTAERDALREEEMGEAKHSNTRAAADIYFQLVEECEIHPGGSLVEYVSDLRERAAAACKGE
ncbi:ead/Ea22-like family protein [Enterobacter hormaechei]|uniref:ead/Ea22-like family protein n=1 Tax=Enterobacter cloacae complex TaxID=354276 RepID=UPI000907DE2F|nr:ead/Ea22-like family protein [Enterobacter hormaechei]HED3464609.1 ead/Ea22-like family protein [Enterobacter hormaechei subsp. steigerwaltii]